MTSTAANPADVRLVAYITADEHARLTAKARDSRRSVSSYVRSLIAADIYEDHQ
jgi:hypothetical protein